MSEVIFIKIYESSTCGLFMKLLTNSAVWRFFMINDIIGFGWEAFSLDIDLLSFAIYHY